ncbi:MAG: prepilin-type N-terminal cleavage/methylation domain-containing protein [Candidatus Scalinduaceae bacterium]
MKNTNKNANIAMKKINNIKQLKNNGFTIIETIVAIAIIAIAMFALMSLVAIVIKGNSHSKRVTTATTIAQDKMEDIIKVGYNNVVADSGTYTANVDYFGTGTAYNIDFYWQTTVQDNTPGTNTKTIKAEVFWDPPGTTSAHNVELETILAQ